MLNFFKKLFSASKHNTGQENQTTLFTEDYFHTRYTEDHLDENILDGSLKMVDSFFIDNKFQRTTEPVNHPVNLDFVVDEGMGFRMYCKAFRMDDRQTLMSLAFPFCDYMCKTYGFKLYRDKHPESPLRSMTLKLDVNGTVMSLYPFEYSLKVLNHEATFEELWSKVKTQIETLPAVDDLLK